MGFQSFLVLEGIIGDTVYLNDPAMGRRTVAWDEFLTGKHRDWMINFCIAMTISFVICGVMTWLRAIILTRWQQKLTLSDSSSFFWHLLRLPMAFFHQRYAAEVASRVNFNESVAGVLSGSAATAILDFFVALFFLTLLFQYNVALTLIGVFFTALDIAIFFSMRQKLTDLIMRIQQDTGKEYGVAMNGLLMIDSIKAKVRSQIFLRSGLVTVQKF